jgi:hypothetical protein
MPLEKPLELIAEADLQRLITDAIPERTTIDYKKQLPGNSDTDKKEFLADVSSFANALGGQIIYGMEETAGLPTILSGVQVIDADSEKLRFENIIRTGVAPRIPAVHIGDPIRLGNGRIVFIIQVPKSWLSPHMVTYQGHSKFYSRNSAGKYPLDVQELRSAFLFSAATTERLRDFRAERLSKIISGVTPAKLQPSGLRIVVHVIPLSALDTRERFDASALKKVHVVGELQPLLSSSVYNSRFNFDGYLISEQFNDPSAVVTAYLQLFRNGIFESVNTLVEAQPEAKSIPSVELEGTLLKNLPTYFAALKKLGIQAPVFLAISIIGTSGYSMRLPSLAARSYAHPGGKINEDTLILPEVMVESFEGDIGESLKPVFDAIWNAAGWGKSIYYEGSKWTGVARFLPAR